MIETIILFVFPDDEGINICSRKTNKGGSNIGIQTVDGPAAGKINDPCNGDYAYFSLKIDQTKIAIYKRDLLACVLTLTIS